MIKKLKFEGTVTYEDDHISQETNIDLLNKEDKVIVSISGGGNGIKYSDIEDINISGVKLPFINFDQIKDTLSSCKDIYLENKSKIEEVWNNSNLSEALTPYNYITHISDSTWGTTFYTMKSDGRGFIKTYYYLDDPDYIYASDLHVDKDMRNKGIGSKLLEIHLNNAKCLGAKYSLLWVRKDTWIKDWYKKLGYKYYKEYLDEANSIWMIKEIIHD